MNPLPSNGGVGARDERGAISLITAEKVVAATQLVSEGLVVSLSRDVLLSNDPEGDARLIATVQTFDSEPGAGAIVEEVSMSHHGFEVTHLDALCHVWGGDGLLWGGVPAMEAIGPSGSTWADVQNLAGGILTRGILVDIPRSRGEPFVDARAPVTESELEEAIGRLDTPPTVGDALIVRCGRPQWEHQYGPYGGSKPRPGLERSCVETLRRWGFSVLVSDMVDADSKPDGVQWGAHAAIYLLGVGLVDNAELEELADACEMRSRSDFLIIINALPLENASGSPVNPVAVL